MLEVQEKILWRDGFCLGIFECGALFHPIRSSSSLTGLLDNPKLRSL
jgi:hypothetical protein